MVGRFALLVAVAAAFCLLAVPAGAATINVDVTNDELNDDGDCALREAVQSANDNQAVSGCAKGQSGLDTIKLKAQQYTIVNSSDEVLNASGDFDVVANGPVAIEGKGPGETTVFQAGDDRVFELFGSRLTLAGMRVSGGDVTSLDTPEGGNIRVEGHQAKLTLNDTDVGSGDAAVGGGISVGNFSKATISKGLFESNDATANGGSLAIGIGGSARIERTTMQLSGVDSTSGSAHGGVIFHAGSDLKIFDSVLQGSSAEASGAGNHALGAAIYAGDGQHQTVLRRSVVRGNTATASTDGAQEDGGGIYVGSGALLIANSTFFDNRAGGPGDDDGNGGAVYGGSDTVDILHTTFDSNQASEEGDTLQSDNGTLRLFGSIIDDATDPCVGNTVTSTGFNVSESIDDQCQFLGSDVEGGDPGLDVFGDNGGPTQTISIQPTSDAKNLVPKGKCKDATDGEDQRGFKRPKGPRCDAGAFERGAKKP